MRGMPHEVGYAAQHVLVRSLCDEAFATPPGDREAACVTPLPESVLAASCHNAQEGPQQPQEGRKVLEVVVHQPRNEPAPSQAAKKGNRGSARGVGDREVTPRVTSHGNRGKKTTWTAASVRAAVQAYVEREGTMPSREQWQRPSAYGLPAWRTLRRHYGSAEAAAGMNTAEKGTL